MVTRVLRFGGAANVTLDSLSIVDGYSSATAGAGVSIEGGAKVAINRCLIARNNNSSIGAGIMIFDGAVVLTNSTVAQNFASDGGAIWGKARAVSGSPIAPSP